MILYRAPTGFKFKDEDDGSTIFERYNKGTWDTFENIYGRKSKPQKMWKDPYDEHLYTDDCIETDTQIINQELEALVIDGCITHDEFFLEKI